MPEAESRDAWMYYVKELHTRFEGYECCIDASAARTAAHEDLKVLFAPGGGRFLTRNCVIDACDFQYKSRLKACVLPQLLKP